MAEPLVSIYEDVERLSRAAADLFVRLAKVSASVSGHFTVALSGGSTPKQLFRTLASEDYRSRVPWARVHFFWGDERTVPPDHSESNFGAARELLLEPLAIPRDNVHRIEAELSDPAVAAARYEEELQRFFRLRERELPRFDLAFLGLGSDGHTASLFPNSDALDEVDRLATAAVVEKLGSQRITLTCPVFNNAACILFLVAGTEKAETLKEVLERPNEPPPYPAKLIRPQAGELLWYVDGAAASLLREAEDD